MNHNPAALVDSIAETLIEGSESTAKTVQNHPVTQTVKSTLSNTADVNGTTGTPHEAPTFPLKTEALVVQRPKADFELVPITLDEIRSDEVLVEMKYSGICHTDIVLQQGLLPLVEFPAIFGHEGAGIVRAIGSAVKNSDLHIGDSVLLSFNVCGECKQCTSNHPSYCHEHPRINHSAVRRDGSTPAKLEDGCSVRSQYFGHSSFARISVVNEKCVVKCSYPENLAVYAPLGCGIQTGAGTILNVLKPAPQDSVVIAGVGTVGLSAIMSARYLGVKTIIAVDLVDAKLDMARELGATHIINSRDDSSPAKTIKELTGGGATFAIECTGVCQVIEMLIECLGPRGTAATVGVPPSGKKIQIDPLEFLLYNKTYVGVIEGDSIPTKASSRSSCFNFF